MDTVSIINSRFISNYANYNGGGISGEGDIIVDSCVFYQNVADDSAGAIHAGGNPNDDGEHEHRITVTSSNFTSNQALSGVGGAIWKGTSNFEGPSVVVGFSRFSSNSALVGGAIQAIGSVHSVSSYYISNAAVTYGGALSVGNYVRSEGDHFTSNSVVDERGGAISTMEANLYSSHFHNNTAPNGGGIYAEFLSSIGSTFTFNSADNVGGGVYTESAEISDSTFTSNIAEYGGGIHSGLDLYLSSSSFTSNVANTEGGGARSGTVQAQSCNFIYNQAIRGAAVFSDSNTTATGSNFESNSASGAGSVVYSNDGYVVLSNCTLSNNRWPEVFSLDPVPETTSSPETTAPETTGPETTTASTESLSTKAATTKAPVVSTQAPVVITTAAPNTKAPTSAPFTSAKSESAFSQTPETSASEGTSELPRFTSTAPNSNVTRASLTVSGNLSEEEAKDGLEKMEELVLGQSYDPQNRRFEFESIDHISEKRQTSSRVNFKVNEKEGSSSSSVGLIQSLQEIVENHPEQLKSAGFDSPKLEVVTVNYAAQETTPTKSQVNNISSSSIISVAFSLIAIQILIALLI
eukprot:TRINITY_DN6112_c0_g1_i2.p1 TRINITY_DN6112_c0_g1~~TRINITY_DN6112_c0_g1_i2.p1  ORF type:complete len:579 (-),score=154.26 TRINITY_DN6112_c0_g1_i2:53-1789(-)